LAFARKDQDEKGKPELVVLVRGRLEDGVCGIAGCKYAQNGCGSVLESCEEMLVSSCTSFFAFSAF